MREQLADLLEQLKELDKKMDTIIYGGERR
jgi:hypothetical protein